MYFDNDFPENAGVTIINLDLAGFSESLSN